MTQQGRNNGKNPYCRRRRLRKILESTLSRDRHICSLTKNGFEAEQFLESEPFELALCDVNIPGESGIILASYIGESHGDTAVVIVTASDDSQTADAAIESGTYGYILKPFNANELIINIRNILRRRKLEIANRMYRQDLEKMVAERTEKLENALKPAIPTPPAIKGESQRSRSKSRKGWDCQKKN